jgi:hypothetical protein
MCLACSEDGDTSNAERIFPETQKDMAEDSEICCENR